MYCERAERRTRRKEDAVPKKERCRLANCPNAGTCEKNCSKCTGPVVWKDANGRTHGMARSCHSCPMNGLGLPVCWAACPGPNQGFQTDGKDMVTLGALEDPDGFMQGERLEQSAEFDNGDSVVSPIMEDEERENGAEDPRVEYERTVTKSLTQDAENACRLLLASLFSVDNPLDLVLIYYAVQGASFSDMSRSIEGKILHDHGRMRERYSKQAAHKRLKKLAEENAIVRAFVSQAMLETIDEAEGDDESRRQRSRRGGTATQQELFGADVLMCMKTTSRRYAEERNRRVSELRMVGSVLGTKEQKCIEPRDAHAREGAI